MSVDPSTIQPQDALAHAEQLGRDLSAPPAAPEPVGVDRSILGEVGIEVTIEVGRVRLTVADLMNLSRGQVLELDRAITDPVDILVNGSPVAKGELVSADDGSGQYLVRIVSLPRA